MLQPCQCIYHNCTKRSFGALGLDVWNSSGIHCQRSQPGPKEEDPRCRDSQLRCTVRTAANKTEIDNANVFCYSASTATIIRLPYLFAIVHHDDFLWYALPVGIWSYIEAGMGITAVSLATLRPVFQSVLVRLGVLTGSGTADRYRYNNAGPNPYQRSVGGSSTLKKAYMRYEDDVFSYDEELQLRGMTPMTRNSSQVEADSQRQPSRKAFSPEPRAENDGMKAWPVVDSDEKINTLMNEDDLAITRTTLDSTCSTINSPAKAFYVQKYPDRVP